MTLETDIGTTEFMGEGEFPADMDRFNWGAFWLTPLWMLLNGFWTWSIGLLLGSTVLQNLVFVVMRDHKGAPTRVLLLPVQIAIAATLFALAVLFGLRGNRMAWEVWRKRSARPGPPLTVSRYMSSQRMWAGAGVLSLAIFALYLLDQVIQGGRPSALEVGPIIARVAVAMLVLWLGRPAKTPLTRS